MPASTLLAPFALVHTAEGWTVTFEDEREDEFFTSMLDAFCRYRVLEANYAEWEAARYADEPITADDTDSCSDPECGQPIWVADQHVDTYYCGFCLESFEARADGVA